MTAAGAINDQNCQSGFPKVTDNAAKFINAGPACASSRADAQ